MKNDTSQIKKAFGQAKQGIKEASREFRIDVATKAFKRIVARSPIHTGSYVLSHRIGVKAKDSSVAMRLFPAVNKEGVKKEALGELIKLKQVGPFDTIIISNCIPHNINVEYVGWKHTPAYQVYGLTFIELFMGTQIRGFVPTLKFG